MNQLATVFLIFFISTTINVFGQEAVTPRPSPLEVKTVKNEDTYVKVTYSRPHKRDREIFGNLVPYGKVWRLGANEATEITLTEDIKMAGRDLAAGTYSLFAIPQEDKWTIIVNSELGLWGAYNYKKDSDVMRFDIPTSTTSETWEAFTIDFEQRQDKTYLTMTWDKTKVSIPIDFQIIE
ncbi:DUF2911 domain-containing protein [Marinigracilibium pacificum]|uniref:DUF2911 domain-containing protein n=1 Tax=Marinigracilibium pacificum TaxID=2729599 RepID=A0A848J4D3_9BACT|nr:DUF2911 domain-containing protein [Marinigracilibium pacificum]NMM49209.1 DUF2911 domain-containing protein [Marinigracilibium pacificum]